MPFEQHENLENIIAGEVFVKKKDGHHMTTLICKIVITDVENRLETARVRGRGSTVVGVEGVEHHSEAGRGNKVQAVSDMMNSYSISR